MKKIVQGRGRETITARALVMLWSTCLLFQQRCIGIKGKIQHTWANTAQLKQIQHPTSFEVCSQVYNTEIKVHFSL